MSYGQSYPQQGYPPNPQGNPGQVLGIVSIVLGLTCGLSLFGFVLGFVSRSRSKRAGASAALGTIGIVVSALAMVLLVLGGVLLVRAANDVAQQCDEVGSGNSYEVNGVTLTCP